MKKSLLAISVLLLSQHVFAAEWILDGKVDPKFGYDDNELLLQTPKGDFSLKLNPTLSLTRALENTKTQLNVGYRVSRYDRLTQLNRQDPFANFNTSYQTERSRYGLKLDYSKRAARSIAEQDTGDFSSNSTVTSKSVTPSFDYNLTEKDKVLTSFGYMKQKNEGTNFSDNRSQTLNLSWQHTYNERLTGGVSGSYTNYHSDTSTGNNKYDSYELSLTSNYALSEVWQINGQLGIRFLKSDITPLIGPAQSADSTGATYSFGADRKGETSNIHFAVARALIPSSTGQVNEQDSYLVSYNKNLSETLSAALTATYRQFSNASTLSTSSKTEYTEFSPSVMWKLERNLSLDFQYKYRQYKRSDAYDTHSNGAFVSVNYNWDGLRFSR